MLRVWYPPHETWRPPAEAWKPWRPPAIDLQMLRTVRNVQLPRRRPEGQLYDPARDTRAQKFYEDAAVFEWPFPPPIDAIELLRFPAIGKIGVVKGMWTWAELEQGPPPGGQPIAPGTRFDPFHMRRNGIELVWHLRLTQRGNYPIGPLWTGPVAELPGFPFYDLPYFHQGQYLWGTPNPIFLLIPRDMTLRLFAHSPNREGLTIGAKFWGYRNVVNMPTSGHNTRHGWT